jgi:hypothetical protein
MTFTIKDPKSYAGQAVGNGQCVRFVQIAAKMPHTSQWRRGRRVRGTALPAGTVIATFDPNGRYRNHTDGRSHAACYLDQGEDGLEVIDQWRGHPVARRIIHFRGGVGGKANDGDQFFVVETEDTQDEPPAA